MNSPIDALPLPLVYYHHQYQDYWMPDHHGKWIRVNETSVKRYLNASGFSKGVAGGNNEIESILLQLQQGQNVAYAAKLAGHRAGCCAMNGNQILVTESPKLIEPKPGDWPLLHQILEGMLLVEEIDQRPYVYGWLKRSLESLRSGKWTQAQVLAFAGPRNSAKSLLQSLLTEMFGGRSAKPFLFMTGRTDFNADLFHGEHLMVEDECESTDFKARRHFAGHIKQVAVNKSHHCHGKNKDGLLLAPWWRMTISLNDDPERLLVLPPITEDIEDKIMIFKVARQPMPASTSTPEAKEAFWKALVAELPAFMAFVLAYEIPERLRCPRFGVRHFHHPEVLSALNETAPENQLLALIDKEVFGTSSQGLIRDQPREFTALDLEAKLTHSSSQVEREARRLLSHGSACGTLLGRLATSHPLRVAKRMLHGQNRWMLQPPAQP